MRRSLISVAVAGIAVLAVSPFASAATAIANGTSPDSGFLNNAKTGLRICISGVPEQGTGTFVIEGRDFVDNPQYGITPVLNPEYNAAEDDISDTCHDFLALPGNYTITPGKYLSAFCLVRDQNTNEVIVNPTQDNPNGVDFTTDRCRAKVHHFHTQHDIFGTPSPLSTIEQPEVTVTVKSNQVTLVSAHVVDVGYPECIEPYNNTNPARACDGTDA